MNGMRLGRLRPGQGRRTGKRGPGEGTLPQRQLRHDESDEQQRIVDFFDRSVAPASNVYMYAVPNGGFREGIIGILQAEGVRRGVADLVLLMDGGRSIYIEMKLPERRDFLGVRKKTYQSPDQKKFQAIVERMGFRYVVLRSLGEFVALLDELGVPMLARPLGSFRPPTSTSKASSS